ncbi:Xaa-Pro peptidase family protein [Burkholderia cenocepacia]|uniref:M24 family metallopeptidase n=1 Tax=Burkholderia cenocepacia TaxID=95486 RepID=UPI0004F8DE73|nr:Xaa-Pro peptidase family protein [Burkholderia cenocepacia]AIO43825.1 metallopeptidase M24 family protein [Burkholderia cepacia]KGC05252.1 metallopeptidase M24 family protein [Burkholderia cepacia]MCG0576792.1 Xaa-Pro peptidase family protein [Burkholderia cenocepacia]MCW3527502.1 Xaa-Pro peptidase family protein [Burkholderia cenocepacia]MCW3617526.1 Xaa-Pro peptidase family protein [Burkholderia cenocepacia]
MADLSFTIDEYRNRLERVQRELRSRDIDVAILDEPEMMGWLSGYWTTENLWRACAVPATGEPVLLVRKLDMAPAKQRSWFTHVVGFLDWEDPLQLLLGTVRSLGFAVERVGVDFQSHSFTVARMRELREHLPHADIRDLDRSLWDLRRCKSDEEIALMRRASTLVDQTLEHTVASIREGVLPRIVAAETAAEVYRLGFDDGFIGPITVATGWDSLHGFMPERPLKSGDMVHIELLPRLRGYSARIMRCVAVGGATAEQKRTTTLLADIQDRQIAAMRPGAVASEIDRIVRHGVVETGLRESYDNITGYTLGLTPLTSQRTSDLYRCFTPKADWELEAGMVFHVYTSAAGIALSETVVVTERGGERLTQSPRVLFER